jgi:hypothetical protein
MKVNQKNWSCPKKQHARSETIISQYKNNFGIEIPKDKQYWTLSGQCADSSGNQLKGCELWQILESKLISKNQFHGVEINKEIYDLNVKAFPDTNWHNDDFYRAMIKAKSNDDFNPAIVNIDLIRTIDGGGVYASKILSFLTEVCDEVLVVVNVILHMRYYKTKNGEDVINFLNKHHQFRHAMRGNWTLLKDYYEYNGTGETGSRTKMGSFIFIKNKG